MASGFRLRLVADDVFVGSPTLASVTIPNVTVFADETLFVFMGTKASGIFAHPLSNTVWNGLSAEEAGQNVLFSASTGATRTLLWSRPPHATGDLVITFTAATKPTDVAVVVVAVERTSTGSIYQGIPVVPTTGSTSPLSATGTSDGTPPSFLFVNHVLLGNVSTDDAGTWTAPLNRIARIGNANIILDLAYREYDSITPAVASKTGFTDRPWGNGASLFSRIVTTGGYTSYDLGLTHAEVSNPVLPEIQHKIAQGDHRFMPES